MLSAGVTQCRGQRGVMLEANADMDFKAMVITGSLPWWSLMAAQMGAKILSTWIDAPICHLDFARKHFGNCPIYDGSIMGLKEWEKWQKCLSEPVVVFFDRHPRESPF